MVQIDNNDQKKFRQYIQKLKVNLQSVTEGEPILRKRGSVVGEEGKKKKHIKLPLPPGDTFESLRIDFVSPTSIQVFISGENRGEYTFSDLGFQDNRKGGDLPNILWTLLRSFAVMSGTIDRNDNLDVKIRKYLSKSVQRLRQHLRRVFCTTDDPFCPYHPSKRTPCHHLYLRDHSSDDKIIYSNHYCGHGGEPHYCCRFHISQS